MNIYFAAVMKRMRRIFRMGSTLAIVLLATTSCRFDAAEVLDTESIVADFAKACNGQSGSFEGRRIVCADLAALDQTLVYNRFGSFNPFGMMYALRRDISELTGAGKEASMPRLLTAEDCRAMTGTESGNDGGELAAGNVRLKDCKRPRPITLRVNVGDVLMVRVSNLLHQPKQPDQLDALQGPGFSEDFCNGGNTQDANRSGVYDGVSRGSEDRLKHAEVACAETAAESGETIVQPRQTAADWPSTRLVNFVVQGLEPISDPVSGKAHDACLGLGAVAPGDEFICMYKVDQEGMYFLASPAAGAGGEGDGGSIVHGLFGAVLAEREGSRWYRSQTSAAAFNDVWPSAKGAVPLHSRSGMLDYEKTDASGVPYLNMARPVDGTDQNDFATAKAVELVHSDLNAIIFCDENVVGEDCAPRDGEDAEQPPAASSATMSAKITKEPAYKAFREFSVFFHDELKTFYTRNFQDIESLGQMAGVKDGFALNYGASGMGSILMANRKGIGPAADCMECLYEEFFLTSWANGDPALLERFADDPSNVHHSYLNDPVVFRNFHAGPKETHVFHLHAHQWFAGNDPNRGTYLDSQTVAPQQGFSYNIYHGGRRDIDGEKKGFWDTQGSGNRNRTIGDSIFHCHLYPHFAQGMWALWRVHDVLEDGTRLLPDGQAKEGLSIDFPEPGGHKRGGSVNRNSGAWNDDQQGTPIPALIPLPGEVIPLLPTYAETVAESAVESDRSVNAKTDDDTQDAAMPMPGFPFYIAGQAGHRPPQAPLDIAQKLFGPNPTGDALKDERTSRPDADAETENPTSTSFVSAQDEEGKSTGVWLDGGMGRHIVKDGSKRKLGFEIPDIDVLALDNDERSAFMSQVVAKSFALGDLSGHLSSANIELLNNLGTPLERAAMGFHYNGELYDPENASDNDDLLLRNVFGDPVSFDKGAYGSLVMAVPGNSTSSPVNGNFAVNSSAPKPGAPFADPCGAPDYLENVRSLESGDPLFGGQFGSVEPYSVDPYVSGFRRYEVSAIQLDLIVNQAGWHDPQARINVLSKDSDKYKDTDTTTNRISPAISDNDEPFFFRALSGECIEFRHTNEVPKELELDDFQVRTPTDTIGQHIHLVKFDVTSSDGSGNGWNYEDGTFAADELAVRRCAAAADGGSIDDTEGSWRPPEVLTRDDPGSKNECLNGEPVEHDIWRLPLTANRDKFQTTVQRWFADPILSSDESGLDQDRTMKTVFTHDHFGPSSIQQHGFYSALVIEPDVKDDNGFSRTRICEADGSGCVSALEANDRIKSVAWGSEVLTGTKKQVKNALNDPLHPDYREFALSIADFALLYDPRDRTSTTDFDHNINTGPNISPSEPLAAVGNQGMQRLFCESRWQRSPYLLDNVCGNTASKDAEDGSWFFVGDVPPAWIAGGTYRDDRHKERFRIDGFHPVDQDNFSLISRNEVSELRKHAIEWRQKAAGHFASDGTDVDDRTLASPVASPMRPEAISVDHHDPYLVNYRGAPIPLRIGDKVQASGGAANDATVQSNDCQPKRMSRPGQSTLSNGGEGPDSAVVQALVDGSFDECSIARQVQGERGDMAGALLSSLNGSILHGDPETPVFEAYQGERMVFRLIQGAQEVQHTFNVVGLAFKRNMDQSFSRGMQPLGLSQDAQAASTRREQCFEKAGIGRPLEYRAWFEMSPSDFESPLHDDPASTDDDEVVAYWQAYQDTLANCDNIEGFTFAQEIGISEHFEMQGSLRSDVASSVEFAADDDPAPDLSAGTTVSELPADFLYNFGSVDALWNGAWGLVRIYQDERTLIPGSDQPIMTRLGGIVDSGQESGDPGDAEELVNAGLACPRSSDEGPVQHTEAVIVAIETRQLWTSGTPYGSGRRDPDGLMLALLDPEAVVDEGFRADSSAWDSVSRERIINAIKARYSRPEPMTLRVNAGDCVRLRLVNLMEEVPGGGLRDRLGDAELPPIVPLNADPKFVDVRIEHDAQDATNLKRVGTLERTEPGLPVGGIRPSASLALNIGLPGMNLLKDLPLPYGNNRPALPPYQAGGKVPVSDEMRFYAGRYRLDINGESDMDILKGKLRLRIRDHIQKDSGRWLTAGDEDYPGSQRLVVSIKKLSDDHVADDSFFKLLGTPYSISLSTGTGESRLTHLLDGSIDQVEQLAETYCDDLLKPCVSEVEEAVKDLRRKVQQLALDALDERTHWIPYAFGAVPVRSVSDVISHAQHGLFGAIDVLPADWELSQKHGVTKEHNDKNRSDEAGNPRVKYRSMSWVDKAEKRPSGASTDGTRTLLVGDPATFDVPVTLPDGSVTTTPLREFVLFYQDGLNLWDDDSRIDWQWDDGLAVTDHGDALKTVPDCIVCDDSYDRGEYAINYRSPAFSELLNKQLPEAMKIGGSVEASDDLNVYSFPVDYLDPKDQALRADNAIRLKACPGEQVVIRIIHPGGRARQHSFAMNGYNYEDLFPGFGFPRSALLAPGKSISAWLSPEMVAGRTTLWHDGPAPIRAGGAWGLLDVADDAESCAG